MLKIVPLLSRIKRGEVGWGKGTIPSDRTWIREKTSFWLLLNDDVVGELTIDRDQSQILFVCVYVCDPHYNEFLLSARERSLTNRCGDVYNRREVNRWELNARANLCRLLWWNIRLLSIILIIESKEIAILRQDRCCSCRPFAKWSSTMSDF